jgi:hypothetical protein
MKFGVQVSESNLKMLVNDFRVSFEPDKREIFGQFDRLLRASDIHIESNLESINLENPLWKYLSYFTEGRGTKDFKIGSDQLQRNFITGVANSKLRHFFINDDISELIGHPVFATDKNGLMKDFGNVSCCPSDERPNSISIRQGSLFETQKWKCFEVFKHPTSSVLIFDPYLFSGDLKGQIFERFEKTILPLITHVVRTKKELNKILLIGSYRNFKGSTDNSQINEKRKRLFAYINDLFKRTGFKIRPKIILYKRHLEHDRRMLTDYIQIKPGSSFQFLNQHGQAPVGGFTVHVAPLFHEDILRDLKDFKRALSKEVDLKDLNM